MKNYRVTLTAEEREQLRQLLARGKVDVRKLKHAQILFKADEAEGSPGWSDTRIAEALDVGLATVERVRRRFIEEGFEAALSPYRGPNRVYTTKLDGEQEAHLIALACSQPPDGRARTPSSAATAIILRRADGDIRRPNSRQTRECGFTSRQRRIRPAAKPPARRHSPPSGGSRTVCARGASSSATTGGPTP